MAGESVPATSFWQEEDREAAEPEGVEALVLAGVAVGDFARWLDEAAEEAPCYDPRRENLVLVATAWHWGKAIR